MTIPAAPGPAAAGALAAGRLGAALGGPGGRCRLLLLLRRDRLAVCDRRRLGARPACHLAAIAPGAVIGMNAFARHMGHLTTSVAYADIVALAFKHLWH